MKTEFEYIHFVKIRTMPKTSVWSCRNNKSGDELGEVKWWGRWRQYCFFPCWPSHSLPGEIVFNASCLDDIAAFVRSLSRKPRPRPKPKGTG